MNASEKTVWDIIEEHKETALLSSRYVGRAPTYEWTGLARPGLVAALLEIEYKPTYFQSNVKGQPCYGKKCLAFVTFGEKDKT